MVNTGWKTPNTVVQDARWKVVNGGTANKWVDLRRLTERTQNLKHYAEIGRYGTAAARASPVIYLSNYGFNIPWNATITKVTIECTVKEGKTNEGIKTKTLKLKTGPSTTDWGVGKNKAKSDRWTCRSNPWTVQTYSFSPQDWGVPLSPQVVNNSNFGAVFQCVGLDNYTVSHGTWGIYSRNYNHWSLPLVNRIRMNVEYSVPHSVTSAERGKFGLTPAPYLSSNSLNISNPNTPIILTISYKHILGENGKYNSGETPVTKVTSSTLKIGGSKLSSYTVPTIKVPTETESSTYTTTVKIYPSLTTGEHTIIVSANGESYTLKVQVNRGNGIDVNYGEDGRGLMIHGCIFKEDHADNTGGAMLVDGKNVSIRECKYISNSATVKCPNAILNGECKS